MQVLCMSASADKCDLECPVCHEKFAIYYSRNDAAECAEAREAVLVTLLEHHNLSALPGAHPVDAFNVPAWDGPAHYSGAAMLSGAPVRNGAKTRASTVTVISSQQRRVS